MYNDIITLVSVTNTVNSLGDSIETTTDKDVFAKYKSIGMKETYEALAVGLKPEISFVIADYLDYDGQEFIEYNNERYNVLRTYRKDSNELEIVVTR